MDILNKKERFSAFALFMLMFSISTGVLIFALYFNFKLPLKENEVLKLENDKMISQANYQKKFSNEFGEIRKLIDSLQKTPEKFVYIENTITKKLGDLDKEMPDDTLSTKLYGRIIVNMQDLMIAKKALLENNDSSAKILELTNDKKDLQKNYDELLIRLQMQPPAN